MIPGPQPLGIRFIHLNESKGIKRISPNVNEYRKGLSAPPEKAEREGSGSSLFLRRATWMSTVRVIDPAS